MSPTKSRRRGFSVPVGIAGILGLITGCTATGPSSLVTTPTVVEHQVEVRTTEPPSPPTSTCDLLASLRPSTLPTPNRMPPGSTMAAIERRGYLIVGVDQNTPLFGYRDPETGELHGFDIDLARAVAAAIFGDPNKIAFRAISSAQRIPELMSRQVDLVANLMTITCERKRHIGMSTDYFDSGIRVLVPKGSPTTGAADLGGHRVCVVSGSDAPYALSAVRPPPLLVDAASPIGCLVLLQQHQVDAITDSDSVLLGLAAEDPTTQMVGDQLTFEPHGLAVNLGAPDFLRFVNAVLAQVRTDGRWTRFYDRWLASVLGPVDGPPQAKYVD